MSEPWLKLAFAAALEAKKLENLRKLEELQGTKQDTPPPDPPVTENAHEAASTATDKGHIPLFVHGAAHGAALGGAALEAAEKKGVIAGILGGAAFLLGDWLAGDDEKEEITKDQIQITKIKTRKSSDALQQLGGRIKSARELRNLTQERCAELAGVSRTALRNLEEGGDTRLSTVFAVSKELSIPLIHLFQGTQPELEEKAGMVLSKKSNYPVP